MKSHWFYLQKTYKIQLFQPCQHLLPWTEPPSSLTCFVTVVFLLISLLPSLLPAPPASPTSILNRARVSLINVKPGHISHLLNGPPIALTGTQGQVLMPWAPPAPHSKSSFCPHLQYSPPPTHSALATPTFLLLLSTGMLRPQGLCTCYPPCLLAGMLFYQKSTHLLHQFPRLCSHVLS